MTTCERLKHQLDAMIEIRKDIQQELRRPDLPPEERAQLIWELKQANMAIADLRRRYNECTTPRPPRPDLVADRFRVTRQGSTRSLAGVLRNVGEAPARGPFKVVLGVTTAAGTRQLTVQVPNSVTIEGYGTEYTTPQALKNIPASDATFHMLVDSDHEVNETLESNNALDQRWPLSLTGEVPATPAADSR